MWQCGDVTMREDDVRFKIGAADEGLIVFDLMVSYEVVELLDDELFLFISSNAIPIPIPTFWIIKNGIFIQAIHFIFIIEGIPFSDDAITGTYFVNCSIAIAHDGNAPADIPFRCKNGPVSRNVHI